MEIVPAILTSDPAEARELLADIAHKNSYSRVQIDFIDGEYAANTTITPAQVDFSNYLNMSFDAHLMVVQSQVDRFVKEAEKVGFDRIIAQVESISEPHEFRGLAIDIHSPLEAIMDYLHGLEVVVLMSIEPGFGGQEFDPEVKKKIVELVQLRKEKRWQYRICIDGGVQKEHLYELENLGVDEVAVGAKRALAW